ncbi:hypothetical protein K4H28_12055 [Deefgea tanakiae]|uniref:Uncharacterized protein n=1 Tax=Deefgea tanakiae TaxID=2865840 RepID=A0ABX8Z378_9NEIS|nr:hypothetical protein [Deefgea tanakiae]QZA77031.1 hypothetical protein K4H28_12055 [Deefgea tanakiae]
MDFAREYIFESTLFAWGIGYFFFALNVSITYCLYKQDQARYPWGEFQFTRLLIAIVCLAFSSLGLVFSIMLILPVFAWAWLFVMVLFWVLNKPMGTTFALIGLFFGCASVLLVTTILITNQSWNYGSGLFSYVEFLLPIYMILPAFILAVFLTRFHYYELADYSK